jgi:hypothetical protein
MKCGGYCDSGKKCKKIAAKNGAYCKLHSSSENLPDTPEFPEYVKTHLEKLVYVLPSAKWDWDDLSANPNISWEFIYNNLQRPWIWRKVSANTNITFPIVISHQERCWDGFGLAENENMTFEHLVILSEKYNISWALASTNKNITWEIIESNPKYSWRYDYFLARPDAPLDVAKQYGVLQNCEDNRQLTWKDLESVDISLCDMDRLSKNLGIPLEKIKETRDKINWDWSSVSEREDIEWSFVKKNIELPWDWHALSSHPNMSWDVLKSSSRWKMKGVSENANTTWEIAQTNPRKRWVTAGLSRNPNITFDIVYGHLCRTWSWQELSRNFFELDKGLAIAKKRKLIKILDDERWRQKSYIKIIPLDIVNQIKLYF